MAEYKVVDTEKLEAGLIATANAVRKKTKSFEKIQWDNQSGMASSIDEVFEAGKTEGYAEGKQVGIDEGVKTEYDRFWDSAQANGAVVSYAHAFAGYLWNDETFKPKYNIVATSAAYHMFYYNEISDLSALLDRYGVILDISKATAVQSMFSYSTKLERVPELDVRGCIAKQGCDSMFASCVALHTIEKLILPSDREVSLNSAFASCRSLANITIEGVIMVSGANFSSCPLTKASITSVINALSATTSGLTVTLKKTAVEAAFGSTAAEEWATLIATKPNWTISLV